jgi:hypothetical protein
MKQLLAATAALLSGLAIRDMPPPVQPSLLHGTWALVAADKILPGGEKARDYGEAPKGRMIVDAQGRYSLQIFKSERRRFAGDKAAGSADEFSSAVLGSSTHYGKVAVDAARGELVFEIEASSFPNWEGSVQRRQYRLEAGLLSYRVPPRADGSVPVSVWRRMD